MYDATIYLSRKKMILPSRKINDESLIFTKFVGFYNGFQRYEADFGGMHCLATLIYQQSNCQNWHLDFPGFERLIFIEEPQEEDGFADPRLIVTAVVPPEYEPLLSLKLAALQSKLEILTKVGTYLDNLHNLGFSHNNLTPNNILVAGERVVIKNLYLPEISLNSLIEGPVVEDCIKCYCPPEILQGKRQQDFKSHDLYAFALIAFQFLVRHPFYHVKPAAVIDLILNDDRPSLVGHFSGDAFMIEAVIEKSLSYKPSARYSSALDFIQDLQAALRFRKDISHLPVHVNYELVKFTPFSTKETSLTLLVKSACTYFDLGIIGKALLAICVVCVTVIGFNLTGSLPHNEQELILLNPQFALELAKSEITLDRAIQVNFPLNSYSLENLVSDEIIEMPVEEMNVNELLLVSLLHQALNRRDLLVPILVVNDTEPVRYAQAVSLVEHALLYPQDSAINHSIELLKSSERSEKVLKVFRLYDLL